MLDDILKKVLDGGAATVDEAMELNGCCSTETLCEAADRVREARCGNVLDTCSIINARSGHCSENCKWCAQSAHYATGVKEYECMPADEVMRIAGLDTSHGVKRLSLVTSGRKVTASGIKYFCDVYRRLAAETPLRLCASMGLLGREELQALKDAGVERYHCNLETSSEYFPTLCTTHTHADKLRTISMAREVGLEVCSGGIIGMGESMRDRLTMAFEACQAGAVSIPVNVLIPIPGTPLGDTEPLSEDEIVRTVALMRLVAPDAVIRFAGGRANLSVAAAEQMLRGGMNGAMIGDLLTTVGNKVDEDYAMFARVGYKVD